MEEIDVTADEALADLRDAMGIPGDVWEHDDQTWTRKELGALLGIGRDQARRRAEDAIKVGNMIEGKVKGDKGHYLVAYRLAE